MKKIMAMMIGLGLMLGTVSLFAADEKKEEPKTEEEEGQEGQEGREEGRSAEGLVGSL